MKHSEDCCVFDSISDGGGRGHIRGQSEDLEAFEQGERCGPPFALSSGRLHCDQFGSSRGWQLLVAGGGEGGHIKQRFVLAKEDCWCNGAAPPSPPPSPPCPPYGLIEDMLHREEVQAG